MKTFDYMKTIRIALRPAAIEAAVSPATHARMCAAFDTTPYTRESISNIWGERAALAWDDMVAARKSFHRECDRYEKETEEGNY